MEKTYYKDFKCPLCEGEGISVTERKELTGNKTFGRKYIKINGVPFDVSFIHNLKLVSDVIGDKVYLVSSPKEFTKGFLFEIGKFRVLIMPVNSAEQEDVLFSTNTIRE